MKKSVFNDLFKVLTVLAILFLLGVPLHAQVPVERTFVVGTNVTYASTNYTTGIHTPVYSSFKPLALDITLFVTNATVTLKRAAAGNAYWSYAMGTATSTVQFVTNDFYWLRGDQIVVSVGAVNVGGTVKVQGLEQ